MSSFLMLDQGLAVEDLPDDVDALRTLIFEKEAALRSAHEEVERLFEIIRLLKRKHFGKSSEKASSEQLGMFNEAEELSSGPSADDDEEEIEVPAHKRGLPKRKPLPENLPRVVKTIELSEEERICPHDGAVMEEIGEEASEKLDVVPMQMRVIRTVRKKYACRCCQEGVKVAPVSPQAIPKGIASEGLLASIATWKYCDHLPLYRIEAIFKRAGVEVPRSPMASSMVRLGQLVQPLVNLLADQLLERGYVQMDETRVQVLNEKGKRAESLSYMWVRASPDPMEPIILFDYDPSRSGDVAKRLLAGFSGRLQADGYDGYAQVAKRDDIIRHGCFAHARRKFKDAAASSNKPGIANKGLKFIHKLYAIEDECRGWSSENRCVHRAAKAKPILDEMRGWLTSVTETVPPSTLVGKALQYCDNEWMYLERYVEDGRVEIDNNFVENAIRPFALGRKNWLFSSAVAGAEASANLFSLVTTAKVQGIEPYRYLRWVFEKLPLSQTVEDFAALLPAQALKVIGEPVVR